MFKVEDDCIKRSPSTLVFVPSLEGSVVTVPPGIYVSPVQTMSFLPSELVKAPVFEVNPISVSEQLVPVSLSQLERLLLFTLLSFSLLMIILFWYILSPVQLVYPVQEAPYSRTNVPSAAAPSSQMVRMSPADGGIVTSIVHTPAPSVPSESE